MLPVPESEPLGKHYVTKSKWPEVAERRLRWRDRASRTSRSCARTLGRDARHGHRLQDPPGPIASELRQRPQLVPVRKRYLT